MIFTRMPDELLNIIIERLEFTQLIGFFQFFLHMITNMYLGIESKFLRCKFEFLCSLNLFECEMNNFY